MIFLQSKPADLNLIFEFYDLAMEFQKKVFHKQWEGFEKELIETEVAEQRQWKIILDGEPAAIFAVTFNDEQFWREKSKDPSLYIHRIVTHPKFKGRFIMNGIVEWAKEYCLNNGLKFIRIDTWGDNPRLINYYINCGFQYVETIQLDKIPGLPAHYKGPLALLEIEV